MRKIFLAVAAMAMLATACTKEDSALVGNESLVSFSVSSPELQTRYGEGSEATDLYYAFYEVNGGTLTLLSDISATGDDETGKLKIKTLISGKATINVPLVDGRHYAAIFWAQAPEAPYTIDWKDTQKMSYKDGVALTANNEAYDAFYAYYPVSTEKTHTVTLTRPFAQINIATADTTEAKNAGFVAERTKVVVKGVCTSFDLVDGTVNADENATLTFDWATKATGKAKTSYDMLAMNYVLVNRRELVDVTMYVNDEDVKRTYTTVPVERNYRTYILGNLLTTTNEFEVETKPGFSGTEEYVANVATAKELKEALTTADHIVLENNINMENEILTITAPETRSSEDVPVRNIVIDGNGKTLTSTADRAINVKGVDGVTIKNLTINASKERAINIIQNATNVTIDNVTATAANYTVNVASSAPNAVVAIKNSTLNGLCTVNVSAEGANVTVDNSTVNCNDNNTTAGESYAALSLNKEAVGGKIIATNTTINVAEGSDSQVARNGAENGTITIDGSDADVHVSVAAITYPGSDYYHGFATLAAAIEFAKDGDKISLIRNIALSEAVTIPDGKNITIDLNGHDLDIAVAYDNTNAFASSAIVNNGTLTLTGNGKIKAINNYTVRNYGIMTIDGVTIENGIMNYNDLTVKDGNISNSRSGKHTIYGNNAKLTINGGTFYNGNPGNAAIFAYAGEVEINGGEFSIADGTATQGWTSCLLDAQGNAKFTINGGVINGEIRDYNKNTAVYGGVFAHSSVKNFVAEGYKAVQNGSVWEVVAE